jgi:hypothetical protein
MKERSELGGRTRTEHEQKDYKNRLPLTLGSAWWQAGRQGRRGEKGNKEMKCINPSKLPLFHLRSIKIKKMNKLSEWFRQSRGEEEVNESKSCSRVAYMLLPKLGSHKKKRAERETRQGEKSEKSLLSSLVKMLLMV